MCGCYGTVASRKNTNKCGQDLLGGVALYNVAVPALARDVDALVGAFLNPGCHHPCSAEDKSTVASAPTPGIDTPQSWMLRVACACRVVRSRSCAAHLRCALNPKPRTLHLIACCLCLQGREVQELRSRLTAADSVNRILARQEREALDQAQAAVAEAQRARNALTPATFEIRCVHV
jgi:hypothetical protein